MFSSQIKNIFDKIYKLWWNRSTCKSRYRVAKRM